ncbi:GumC family protein [Salinibacter ruber]|uniref:GumC family protein n=1 Tax=Salinibacter ruber TaxID=146919 RepID=UPI0021692D6D|nr:polysaccharide biosynthesis tyrosine autokinase [Salinibacter ruber]MCS4198072.1 capsular exopolysaccharide synthesis family protein [Salinibacter ruber]
MANDSIPPSNNGRTPDLVNGQAGGMTGPHDDEITLQEITNMLWGGKWVILATFVVVVALGAAYTFLQTPIYETSSLVLVEQQGGVSSVLGEGSSYGPFGSRGNLVNEVLVANQSESIIRSVAARLDTMQTHPRTGEPLTVLTGPEGKRRTVGQIASDLRFPEGKATMSAVMGGQGFSDRYTSADALNLIVKGVSPSETALISNLYAQAYIDYNRRKSKESARSTRKFLEQQAAKFRTRVDRAEQELETFMREEKAVALDQETSRIVTQIANLQTRRDELRIELDMKQQVLNSKKEQLANIRPNLAERISSGLGEELSQVQKEKAEVATEINEVRRNNPNLGPGGTSPKAREFARLKERARQLEQESDSLAQKYVRQTIAAGGIGSISATGQGRRGGGRQGQGLSYVVELQRQVAQKRIEVSGLQAQLSTVKERLAEYQKELDTLPAQSLQLAQLQRERRAAEQMYQFVQEQLQETRMVEESEVGYAEVIRSAGIPGSPVSPNTRLHLVLAAFLGLLGGMGLVFLREALDRKLRAPEDLEALGTKVLGTVPDMQELLEAEFGGNETVEIDGRSVPSQLVMLTSPVNAAAESYRRLRANLQFARPDDQIRSLIVSSASKGEGKTTTAANLSLSMASSGRRTLLVDADLRRPQLHRYFAVSKTPGLSEALYDETIVEGTGAMDTGIDDLSVLTSGGEMPNPSEVLGSGRMRRFLERMEEEFDIVIVDTPPLLLFSDPMSVVSHTDGALLVAQANRTDSPAFEQALSLLDDVDSEPLGSVLNQFDAERAGSYGYGYGYGYGYSYGDGYGYGYQQYGSVQDYYEEDDASSSGGPLSFLRR